MRKILIIEDEAGVRWNLIKNLSDEFRVFSTETIYDATNWLMRETPDLILLDVNLPDGNGVDFCRKLRNKQSIPVIILTVLDDEDSLIDGLSAGADDYLVKPFSLRELSGRIHALFRRIDLTKKLSDTRLDLGKYTLKAEKRELVFQNQKSIILTEIEYRILWLLMRAQGGLVTREQFFARLWDQNNNFVEENTLSVNISRIRKKIIEISGLKPIKTVRGVGYRFEGDETYAGEEKR